jgi:arsenate reductase
MDFYCHPTCTTCKKAQKWLDEKGITYNWVNLKETAPAKETFLELMEDSSRTMKSFFNTSGQQYRKLGLKDKLPEMTKEEAAELLASDGMLVKRPLAIQGDLVTVGFKEEVYEQTWG